jgi:hypothetical protein
VHSSEKDCMIQGMLHVMRLAITSRMTYLCRLVPPHLINAACKRVDAAQLRLTLALLSVARESFAPAQMAKAERAVFLRGGLNVRSCAHTARAAYVGCWASVAVDVGKAVGDARLRVPAGNAQADPLQALIPDMWAAWRDAAAVRASPLGMWSGSGAARVWKCTTPRSALRDRLPKFTRKQITAETVIREEALYTLLSREERAVYQSSGKTNKAGLFAGFRDMAPSCKEKKIPDSAFREVALACIFLTALPPGSRCSSCDQAVTSAMHAMHCKVAKGNKAAHRGPRNTSHNLVAKVIAHAARMSKLYVAVRLAEGENCVQTAMAPFVAPAANKKPYHSDVVLKSTVPVLVEHIDVTIVSPIKVVVMALAGPPPPLRSAALARKDKILKLEDRHPGATTAAARGLVFTPFVIESYGAVDTETKDRFTKLAQAAASAAGHSKGAQLLIRRHLKDSVSAALALGVGQAMWAWRKHALAVPDGPLAVAPAVAAAPPPPPAKARPVVPVVPVPGSRPAGLRRAPAPVSRPAVPAPVPGRRPGSRSVL